MNRTYSNDHLRTKSNETLKHNKLKPLLPLTEYHRQRWVKYWCQLITREDTEPGTRITFDPVTLVPIDHGKQRVGQPRFKVVQGISRWFMGRYKKEHWICQICFYAWSNEQHTCNSNQDLCKSSTTETRKLSILVLFLFYSGYHVNIALLLSLSSFFNHTFQKHIDSSAD